MTANNGIIYYFTSSFFHRSRVESYKRKCFISNLDVPVHHPVSCEPAIILVIGRQVQTYLALEGLEKASCTHVNMSILLVLFIIDLIKAVSVGHLWSVVEQKSTVEIR